jgi:hypothetical protein
MVQYLFAAYSLNDGVESSEFRKKVVLWRNLILSIAKEEMGHLLHRAECAVPVGRAGRVGSRELSLGQ